MKNEIRSLLEALANSEHGVDKPVYDGIWYLCHAYNPRLCDAMNTYVDAVDGCFYVSNANVSDFMDDIDKVLTCQSSTDAT